MKYIKNVELKILIMKTKVLALALAGVFALNASAQEVATSAQVVDQPGKNVTFQRNRASDNWFITLQGGTNYGMGFSRQDIQPNTEFVDQLGISAGLGFGKWYTPYFASRMMIDYNLVKDAYAQLDGDKLQQMHSLNPHIDFMFNMSNYFGRYSAERVFGFVPWIGVGYFGSQIVYTTPAGTEVYQDANNFNHAVSGNMGIDLNFRLGRVANLTLAPSVTFTNLFASVKPETHKSNDMLAQLRLGLTFNTGRSDFEAIVPMDYALLNTLQSEINSLRSQNAELSKRPVRCPECPEVAPAVTNVVKAENVVYFRIGSSNVDRNQLLNIYNTAEFVKSNNVPVTVVGYADAQTGSSDYNMQLSEKRAREVARILTDQYGVPSSQITIDYKGDTVQPFAENAWNRVVIMTAEK